MATRSRRGCIDCKQAKVKCDELFPSCGTCARRHRKCSGYAQRQSVSHGRSSSIRESCSHAYPGSGAKRRASVASSTSSLNCGLQYRQSEPSWAPLEDDEQPDESVYAASATQQTHSSVAMDAWLNETTSADSAADYLRSMILQASTATPSPLRGPSVIPFSEIVAADKPFIEVYFMRHPSEMVMSNDFFIHEMNGAVISLLQQNPTAVSDSLAAIGENYVKDAVDAALVSNRKVRLLSRLRLINQDGSSAELVLLLLLALCGVELVDPRSDGRGNVLSALIKNVSMILEFHTRSGKKLNDVAKYFARAVARQDLTISLSRMQRPSIDPAIWLDEHSTSHADRLMGLTTTLAPILSELSALAEDINAIKDSYSITDGSFLASGTDDTLTRRTDLAERAMSIQAQLVAWRPVRDRTISAKDSQKFLLHAYAWRAAALLYLFRLSNRPGRSPEADEEGLSMAYEVIVHISGPPEHIKMSVWPLFIAACEMQSPEDREHATRQFDAIYRARAIATTIRTRSFCVDQIWPARDSGGNWDWMHLVRLGSNGIVPL